MSSIRKIKVVEIVTLIVAFTVFFAAKSLATSVTVWGEVAGQWNADTILVEGDLLVPQGQVLSIAPGTVIQFQSYYKIDVAGCIKAIGNETDTILFTIRDTSNFYALEQSRGAWSGIRFRQINPSEDTSVFSFCRFEFSKATDDSINCYGGAIQAYNCSKLRINNCLFYHNYSFVSGGAVYLHNCPAVIKDNTFSWNYSGNTGTVYGYGGGVCALYSAPEITGNQFYHNTSTGVGGAASFDNSDPDFHHNIMKHNYSALGGALGILRSAPTHTIHNNLISSNSATFFGGGICCIRSFPVFSNLTITNNDAAYAGAFYCNDSAMPATYNSILWGNTGFGQSVYIWDIYSAPDFYYCDIEGDTTNFEGSGAHLGYHGTYLNNLNTDPLFLGNGMYEYQLYHNSPCINTGIPDAAFLGLSNFDLANNQRINDSRIDMGVYEYNGTILNRKHNNLSELSVYPNPFSHHVTISLPESKTNWQIDIYDISGRLLYSKMTVPGTIQTEVSSQEFSYQPASKTLLVVKAYSANKIVSKILMLK